MSLLTLTRNGCSLLYQDALKSNNPDVLRQLCKEDLFFLLTRACRRVDMNHDWIYARCREVQAEPDGYLDIWAREHYKSSIITFGMTIFDILNNPERTFGFFSHTRPIAKAFLSQIKQELETNTFLKNLFPDVLYQDPQKESPSWSLDNGITVKRKSNPKEKTIEAWGLVDNQPTSKHYTNPVYDDVVVPESITTPEMIKKTTDAWALSLNLWSKDAQARYIGTRYHQLDTYQAMIDRKAVKVREHYPTDKGKTDIEVNGTPFILSKEQLLKKREGMGEYIYACQMLQNPRADSAMGFKDEWLERYNLTGARQAWNYYLLADPANEKQKKSDYTVMAVVGLAPDLNYYLVDGLRDRMNLTERANALIALHRKWKPKKTAYEKYGKDADIEHVKFRQEQEEYRFVITEVGGGMAKNERIRRLVPIFEQHRFYLPHRLLFKTVTGEIKDFVQEFLRDEYAFFPVCAHDDMLDCLARIEDIGAVFPKEDNVGVPIPIRKQEPFDIFKSSHANALTPSRGSGIR